LEARDALRAKPPREHRGPVIVSREALLEMLDFFRTQTSAQSKFQKLSQLEIGDPVFGDRAVAGEPFTLRSNALLPYGLLSAPFDAEGLPGRDVLVIDQNVLRCPWAGQRYARYLDLEPTGAFANMIVPAGTTPMAELSSDGPVIHIVAFSDVMPNPVTGDVVAEIRLGYLVDGDCVSPIKGGALSTNLFDAFATAVYSSETAFLGRYLGPVGIRFDGLTVSGA
jgi:PmbA protein